MTTLRSLDDDPIRVEPGEVLAVLPHTPSQPRHAALAASLVLTADGSARSCRGLPADVAAALGAGDFELLELDPSRAHGAPPDPDGVVRGFVAVGASSTAAPPVAGRRRTTRALGRAKVVALDEVTQ